MSIVGDEGDEGDEESAKRGERGRRSVSIVVIQRSSMDGPKTIVP